MIMIMIMIKGKTDYIPVLCAYVLLWWGRMVMPSTAHPELNYKSINQAMHPASCSSLIGLVAINGWRPNILLWSIPTNDFLSVLHQISLQTQRQY